MSIIHMVDSQNASLFSFGTFAPGLIGYFIIGYGQSRFIGVGGRPGVRVA